eukprot:Hpha_TRINITY_DN20591_c0_g1::TRINITY_DN20591_c0_g1_i1::g.30703::m.30703
MRQAVCGSGNLLDRLRWEEQRRSGERPMREQALQPVRPPAVAPAARTQSAGQPRTHDSLPSNWGGAPMDWGRVPVLTCGQGVRRAIPPPVWPPPASPNRAPSPVSLEGYPPLPGRSPSPATQQRKQGQLTWVRPLLDTKRELGKVRFRQYK